MVGHLYSITIHLISLISLYLSFVLSRHITSITSLFYFFLSLVETIVEVSIKYFIFESIIPYK